MATMPAARAKKLQEMLNAIIKPKPPLTVDGILGPKSKDAIKKFQAKAGLKVSGEIDGATSSAIARAMRTGKVEKEQPEHFIKVGSQVLGKTKKEYSHEKNRILKGIKNGPLREMRSAVIAIESNWEHFDQQNKDQWFVSWCIEVTHSTDLPPKSLIKSARKAYEACDAAIKAGDLQKYYSTAPKSEATINEALAKMAQYRSTMIDGAGNWTTVLTFTKTGAFAFVGTFAAPVTGAALGTGVLASAVVGGAAASATESFASEIGKWSSGSQNWTIGGAFKRTLIDAGVGGILGVFAKGGKGGKHVLEAAATKIAPQLTRQTGFKLLSKATLKKATLFLMLEGGKKTMEGAVKDTAKAVKGDPKLTMDKFVGNLANNFVSGIALGPIAKVIEKFSIRASDHLSPQDKKRIWDLVLKELSRQSKGKTFHIGMVDKRTKGLVEKVINDQVSKQLDNVLDVIFDTWKGPMSPQALQKKISEMVVSSGGDRKIALQAAKAAKK